MSEIEHTEHVYDEQGVHWVATCPKCVRELQQIDEEAQPLSASV